MIGIEAGGDDEAEPPAGPQQAVGGLQKQLVEVEVGGALVAERMRRIAVAGAAAARLPPAVVQRDVFGAARGGEAVLTLGGLLRVAERVGGVADEVGLRAKAGVVVEPAALQIAVDEVAGLPAQRLLLAVGAVERVDVTEKLLRDRLGDVPRRVAEDGVEAVSRGAEHVRELKLPVEEAELGGHARGDRLRPRRRGGEGGRQRGAVDLIGRPEPAGAPAVERGLERLPRRRTEQVVPVAARPLGGVLHRQGVHRLQHRQRLPVRGSRCFQ